MATITIQRQWREDDLIAISVESDNDYPDALNQASQEALRLYRETIAYTIALETGD